MTDEFAINILEQYRKKPTLINEIETVEEAVWLDEALAMGIQALKQKSCEDTINRQAVDTLVDELARAISDERCCISRGRSTATIMQDILDLPSVKLQPKTGRWIDTGSGQMCSECGGIQYGYDNFRRFCASCGIRMIEPQKSEVKKNDEI